MTPFVPHAPSKGSDQSVSESDSGHLDQEGWLVFTLFLNTISEVHDLNAWNRHLHWVILHHQQLLKQIIVSLPISFRLKIDVDEFFFCEGQIKVQRKDKSAVRGGELHHEVIQMSIAVPLSVVVEEPPIDPIPAKNTLYLTHLPPNSLQQCLHGIYPVWISPQQIFYSLAMQRTKFSCNLMNDLVEVVSMFESIIFSDFANVHVIFQFWPLVIFFQKLLTLFNWHLEVSQQFSEAPFVFSLFFAK